MWAKAYSSGTEDNGIHIALNDTLPESGQRMQWCGGKNNWTWSSAQRTDENHCGVKRGIFLEFAEAGVQSIKFFAREDGFELDQFMLVKNNTGGLVGCEPLQDDRLRCSRNATGVHVGDFDIPVTPTIDGAVLNEIEQTAQEQIDLDLSLTTAFTAVADGDSVTVVATITHEGGSSSATNVVTSIDLPGGVDYAGSGDCTEWAGTVTCSVSDLAPDESQSASFLIEFDGVGSRRLSAQVNASQLESDSQDNSDSLTFEVADQLPVVDAGLEVLQGPNIVGRNDFLQYLVRYTNHGLSLIHI